MPRERPARHAAFPATGWPRALWPRRRLLREPRHLFPRLVLAPHQPLAAPSSQSSAAPLDRLSAGHWLVRPFARIVAPRPRLLDPTDAHRTRLRRRIAGALLVGDFESPRTIACRSVTAHHR